MFRIAAAFLVGLFVLFSARGFAQEQESSDAAIAALEKEIKATEAKLLALKTALAALKGDSPEQTPQSPPAKEQDLSKPLAEDPSGWSTLYWFEDGRYRRRLLTEDDGNPYAGEVPGQPVGNFMETAEGWTARHAELGVSFKDKKFAPGWYKIDAPGYYIFPAGFGLPRIGEEATPPPLRSPQGSAGASSPSSLNR